MPPPKSSKTDGPTLRFRTSELMRLRIKRIALFYGDNSSEWMERAIISHLQDQEFRLELPRIQGLLAPLAPTFSSYADLPPDLQKKCDELTSAICKSPSSKSLEDASTEGDATYELLMSAGKNAKASSKKKGVSRKVARLRDIREVTLSIFGTIPAGWADNIAGLKPKATVKVPAGKYPANAFGLEVHGDSMNAAQGKLGHIYPGDTVVLTPFETFDKASGKIVAALCDGKTTLKRLACANKKCQLVAESTNPRNPRNIDPEHDLIIQGVVIGKL